MKQKLYNIFTFSTFKLKILACVLMTLDHIALLFIKTDNVNLPTNYYILRSIGKIALPLFVFLCVEGVYKTRNIKKYLLRIGAFAFAIELIGYIAGSIFNMNPIDNPMLGNVMIDMFLGVLAVYLLKRKDWYSLLAILPITYSVLSCIELNNVFGTITKTDWGIFSMSLFVVYFISKEIVEFHFRRKAINEGVQADFYLGDFSEKYHKYAEAIGLVFVEACFYLLFRINYQSPFIPQLFVPLGTYSTLAFVFILLYNGKKGPSNKAIQWSFYIYYPLHLLILGIISYYFGVLGTVIQL